MDGNEISGAKTEISYLMRGKEKRFVDGEYKYVPLDASREDILKLARARIIDLAAERRRKAETLLEMCRRDELRLSVAMHNDFRALETSKIASQIYAIEGDLNSLVEEMVFECSH